MVLQLPTHTTQRFRMPGHPPQRKTTAAQARRWQPLHTPPDEGFPRRCRIYRGTHELVQARTARTVLA